MIYLWRSLKGKVYKTNLHILEEIDNVPCKISTISGELLLKQEVVHPVLSSKLINFMDFSIIECIKSNKIDRLPRFGYRISPSFQAGFQNIMLLWNYLLCFLTQTYRQISEHFFVPVTV